MVGSLKLGVTSTWVRTYTAPFGGADAATEAICSDGRIVIRPGTQFLELVAEIGHRRARIVGLAGLRVVPRLDDGEMALAVLALEQVEAHVSRLLAARRSELLDELDRLALRGRGHLEVGDGIFGRSRSRRQAPALPRVQRTS